MKNFTLLALAVLLAGCGGNPYPAPTASATKQATFADEMNNHKPHFASQVLSWQQIGPEQYLVTDMETGCQSFYIDALRAARILTPRLGSDGQPLCGAGQQLEQEKIDGPR